MKMVVGLGNPGEKYHGTRHNVGFEVLAELAKRWSPLVRRAKFHGEIGETTINNEKTLLVCPLTYMNLSGQCVAAAVNFYKLELADLLIVCDDFNLDVGRIRLKPNGSAGGQNGLDDIIIRLGTQNVPRLRLGVGPLLGEVAATNFVLGRFRPDDRRTMDQVVVQAADAVESWIANGIQTAMNRFNVYPKRDDTSANSPVESDQNDRNKGNKSS
jgi:PTH1 family peptidyl-tRNA hydrolase